MANKVDLNQADMEELAKAFQVSRERAQKILEKRTELGGFKSWDDVKKVPGVSEDQVDDLKDAGITLGSSQSEAGQQEGEAAEEEEEEEE
jgi:competence ComEA-like helix-hairpin-helix protein